jgi:uncharacterized phage protein (TIGR02218 family)
MTLEVSETFEAAELEEQRRPYELYRIWLQELTTEEWCYTNGDIPVAYNTKVYYPAPIERGSIEWDVELQVSKLEVTFASLNPSITQFLTSSPIELVWVEVLRGFRDLAVDDVSVVFIGQIRSVSFQAGSGVAECVGMEFFLEKPIPNVRYQAACNWKVYDDQCTLNRENYCYYGIVASIGEDATQITVTGINDTEGDFLKYGWLELGPDWVTKRMISASSGGSVTMRYPIAGLQVGDGIRAYAGCDGDIETCHNKFGNVLNFGGHCSIPTDNPSAWSNY